jgi:hypothetical protein
MDDTHRHFNARGAVGESLSDRHAAPLPLALKTQLQNALLCVLHQDWVKEVFHLSWSPLQVEVRVVSKMISPSKPALPVLRSRQFSRTKKEAM